MQQLTDDTGGIFDVGIGRASPLVYLKCLPHHRLRIDGDHSYDCIHPAKSRLKVSVPECLMLRDDMTLTAGTDSHLQHLSLDAYSDDAVVD